LLQSTPKDGQNTASDVNAYVSVMDFKPFWRKTLGTQPFSARKNELQAVVEDPIHENRANARLSYGGGEPEDERPRELSSLKKRETHPSEERPIAKTTPEHGQKSMHYQMHVQRQHESGNKTPERSRMKTTKWRNAVQGGVETPEKEGNYMEESRFKRDGGRRGVYEGILGDRSSVASVMSTITTLKLSTLTDEGNETGRRNAHVVESQGTTVRGSSDHLKQVLSRSREMSAEFRSFVSEMMHKQHKEEKVQFGKQLEVLIASLSLIRDKSRIFFERMHVKNGGKSKTKMSTGGDLASLVQDSARVDKAFCTVLALLMQYVKALNER
jgi:hypothetical protein